eukprot:1683954-Pyramimonas_sp.AAC.1
MEICDGHMGSVDTARHATSGSNSRTRAKFQQQISAHFKARIATALAGSHPTVRVDPNGHVSVSDWPIYPHR